MPRKDSLYHLSLMCRRMSSATASRLSNARGAVKPLHWGALVMLCKVLFALTLCFGPGACAWILSVWILGLLGMGLGLSVATLLLGAYIPFTLPSNSVITPATSATKTRGCGEQ